MGGRDEGARGSVVSTFFSFRNGAKCLAAPSSAKCLIPQCTRCMCACVHVRVCLIVQYVEVRMAESLSHMHALSPIWIVRRRRFVIDLFRPGQRSQTHVGPTHPFAVLANLARLFSRIV